MERPTRREQARALRRAGLSRNEIAKAMGLKSSGCLSKWLKGVPPPPGWERPRQLDGGLRRRAVDLRLQGLSYREIYEALGVAKSTLSYWLRAVPLTEEHAKVLADRKAQGPKLAAETLRARRVQHEEAIKVEASGQIGSLSPRELFVAGIALYWAEGAKSKPWSPSNRVAFINSDPDVIRLFLAWLRLIGVDPNRLIYRVAIHESADVKSALAYWAEVVGVQEHAFMKTTLKRHNPKTVRRNIGVDYFGCLIVVVRRSTDLNRRIAGWWAGIAAATGNIDLQSGVV